jgi:type I restriction enzyme M protein
MGKKNCELSPEDIERISRTFLDFTETPESKIFPNAAFGYWKVTVERPLRLHSQLSLKAIETLRFTSGDEEIRAALYDEFGDALFTRFASLAPTLEERLAAWGSDDDEGDEEDGSRKGLPEKKRKSCSIRRRGSAMAGSSMPPPGSARHLARASGKITTSSANASTQPSARPASNCPPPI